MPAGPREEPLPAFRFRVDLECRNPHFPMPDISRVTEVTGLVQEVRAIIRNPGEKEPDQKAGPGVILRRGVTKDSGFWDWFCLTQDDPSLQCDVRIVLMDADGRDAVTWRLVHAYPVRWTGPELRADSSAVAFESLELRYDRITRD